MPIPTNAANRAAIPQGVSIGTSLWSIFTMTNDSGFDVEGGSLKRYFWLLDVQPVSGLRIEAWFRNWSDRARQSHRVDRENQNWFRAPWFGGSQTVI